MKKAEQILAFILVFALILGLGVTAFADEAQFDVTRRFLAELDGVEGAEYTVVGVREAAADAGFEYERVEVRYEGVLSDYINTVYVDFSEDGEEVMLYLYNIISFRREDREEVLSVLNELNAKYKGVKFYLDDVKDTVTAELYLAATDKTVVEISLFGFGFLIGITDQAYDVLADYAA